jgi:hypothetical protein
VRVKKVLMAVLGLCRETVVLGWELHDGARPRVEVWLRVKARRRGRCGRCGKLASCYDRGGGERRWRHVDVGFATCELIADAPRVDCPAHGPTVVQVPWARHDSAFTRAFEDLVVHDAIVGNKQAAADRYGVSWRAVNNMCVRVATEALGRCWRSSKIAFCDHRKSRCRIDEGRGWRGGASPGVRLAITSFEQFGDGDRLVAAGAWGSDAGGPHEGVAVGAVLVAERAGVAVVADVDGHGPLGAFGRDGWPWDGGGVASAPGGLAAGVGAVTAPTGRHEVGSAVRTGPYRYAIVTRRAVSGHGGLLGWRWAVGRRRGGGWLR